jgi:hypothetical protein
MSNSDHIVPVHYCNTIVDRSWRFLVTLRAGHRTSRQSILVIHFLIKEPSNNLLQQPTYHTQTPSPYFLSLSLNYSIKKKLAFNTTMCYQTYILYKCHHPESVVSTQCSIRKREKKRIFCSQPWDAKDDKLMWAARCHTCHFITDRDQRGPQVCDAPTVKYEFQKDERKQVHGCVIM